MKNPKLGSNRTQSFIELLSNLGPVKLGLEGKKLFYQVPGSNSIVYLTDNNGNITGLTDDAVSTSKIQDDAITDAKIYNKNIVTIKKTIGGVGVADCDFNFATAENQNEQAIDLGAIIPAKARIIDIFSHTNAVFTGAITLVADVGNTSGGAQFISSATIYATDAILAAAAGSAPLVAPNVAASNVFVNATPGANWSLVTAGKATVYITYIDLTNV